MAIKESVLISWTVENNEAGAWALFARMGGVPNQMTTWYETKAQLMEALKGRFTVEPITESPQT